MSLAVPHEDTGALGALVEQLRFVRTGRHRSKDVSRYRQGGTCLPSPRYDTCSPASCSNRPPQPLSSRLGRCGAASTSSAPLVPTTETPLKYDYGTSRLSSETRLVARSG